MDIIDELKAFVATAQTGSFTAAANQLGISNRLTSKYVAELEARLGERLFQRTTRKVGLTPAGEDLLARAPSVLDDLDDLLAHSTEAARGLSGTIRISAPVMFGEIYLGQMLGRFACIHPDLSFDIRLNDRFADLAAEGIDLAFRIGHSDMLSLKTRRLGFFQSAAAASPEYIAQHGMPRTPADLARHACIIDTNRRQSRRWVFTHADGDRSVTVDGRFNVNSARAAVELATQGLGVVFAPRFAMIDELANGTLTPVLDGYAGEAAPLSAVYLEGRTLPRKVRTLIDFAQKDLQSSHLL